MTKLTTKKWFVGCDLSKDKINYALVSNQQIDIIDDQCYSNSIKGFEKMAAWLGKKSIPLEQCVFCFEHTGNYGLLVFSWLSTQELTYCVEPALQIKRSLGMTRGKNDRVDARRIAQYAYSHKDHLKSFELPAKQLLGIKQQMTYRDQLVRIRTSLKNSFKAHELYEQMLDNKEVSEDIALQIEDLTTRINQLERRINQMIREDKELWKNYRLATSVKGVGFVIGVYMLLSTKNFQGFENGRKYACYAGVAPFESSSGHYHGRTQVSHLANKKIKTLLSNGANSAVRHDPEIRAYYNRKTEEGKDHKVIINAVCCKLINRVFAAIKRGTPYVTTYSNYLS